MNKAIATGVAAAIALAGLPAQAGDNAGMKYFVLPRVDMVIVDRDRNVDDGYQLGAGFGFGLNERWNFELNVAQGWHDAPPAPGNLKTTSFSVNGLRIFYPAAKASPYFNLGVGLLSKDFRATGRTEDAMIEAGVGILIDVFEKADESRKLQIRPEVKVRYDFADDDPGVSDYSDLVAGIGFQYAFGPARVEPVQAEPPPPPPPPPPAPPPPPPKDSDGDGVFDDKDRCPNTAPGTKVDEIGCFVQVSLNLRFATNSAELTADDRRQLDSALATLKDFPADVIASIRVQIAGHTDSVGSDAYNQGLSERRAASVRDYLATGGFPSAQMSTVGFGETQPVASNDSPEGRAANRRVDITAER